MRQRITVQMPAQTESRDSYGQPISQPTTIGTFWAEVLPLTGHELAVARQLKAQASHKVRLRYQGAAPLSPEMILTLKGRTLGVIEVRNVEERNRRFEMTCWEMQGTGPV